MKVLKRKDMLTKVIAVRVSSRAKADFDELRERADAAGFDIGATLRDMLANTTKQITSSTRSPGESKRNQSSRS